MPAEPARQRPRQRPLYPSLVNPPRARDLDGRKDVDGQRDRPTVDPSVTPSQVRHPSRARPLSASQYRLVGWLETYCTTEIPKHFRPSKVHAPPIPLGTFIGGRRFVLKYGADTILEVLSEMTYKRADHYGSDRFWRAEIVSPAHFLHAMVKDLAEGWR